MDRGKKPSSGVTGPGMNSANGSIGAALHAFIRYRLGWKDRLYGVVDAARDPELAFAARDEFERPIRWLFADDAGWHMTDVAPYLVPIEFHEKYPFPGSGYLEMWAERLGNSAGILLISKAEPEALRGHLQTLFHVTLEDDAHDFYFRFYDPRVLRSFLPTCAASEAREFFGPIERILVEAEAHGRMAVCGMDQGQLKMQEGPLGKPVLSKR